MPHDESQQRSPMAPPVGSGVGEGETCLTEPSHGMPTPTTAVDAAAAVTHRAATHSGNRVEPILEADRARGGRGQGEGHGRREGL